MNILKINTSDSTIGKSPLKNPGDKRTIILTYDAIITDILKIKENDPENNDKISRHGDKEPIIKAIKLATFHGNRKKLNH